MKYTEITESIMRSFTSSATDERLDEARENIRKHITEYGEEMAKIRKKMDKVKRDGKAWNKLYEQLIEINDEWDSAGYCLDAVSLEMQERATAKGDATCKIWADTREFLVNAAGF